VSTDEVLEGQPHAGLVVDGDTRHLLERDPDAAHGQGMKAFAVGSEAVRTDAVADGTGHHDERVDARGPREVEHPVALSTFPRGCPQAAAREAQKAGSASTCGVRSTADDRPVVIVLQAIDEQAHDRRLHAPPSASRHIGIVMVNMGHIVAAAA
jgi:hypothetical protein